MRRLLEIGLFVLLGIALGSGLSSAHDSRDAIKSPGGSTGLTSDPASGAPSTAVGSWETHEGTIQVLHEDGAGGSKYHHFLDTPSGQIRLQFSGELPGIKTGDRVRVRGNRTTQQTLAVGTAKTAVTTVAAAALPNTFGAQQTAVIVVKFQDNPNAIYYTPAQLAGVVFGTGPSVTNLYQEMSYQQTSFTGNVFGPYVIPVNSTSCDYSGIATYGQQAATAAGVNLSGYPRRVFAFPSNACAWWGLGTVGGNPSMAWINGGFYYSVVSHELGHNLGLFHSHALECGTVTIGGTCSNIEYGDTLDVMGSSSPPEHFNAVQKERLGWLNNGAMPPITAVQASGVYTLDPYEPPGSNPKALKVKTVFGDWYYVEFRRPIGFDSPLASNPNVMNGVVVHYWSGASPNAIYLLDMTPATSSWSDPALTLSNTFTDSAAGISITPVWVNGTAGVNVNVNVGAGTACVRNNPTVGVSPAQQQGAPGITVGYSVSVTNNDTGCATSSFTLQSNAPAGWTAAFVAPTLAISPGASASTTLQVTSATSAAAGTYTIAPAASNASVASSAGSTTATYAVAPTGTTGTISDGFNRPDSATLGNGWVQISGSLMIESGQARNAETRSLHMAVMTAVVGATETASMDFTSVHNNNGPRFGVVLRYKDSKNYYTCYRQTGGSSVLRIARVVNEVETILKSVSLPNPTRGVAFTLGCQAQGSTLTLTFGGAAKGSVTDTAFSSGSVGFFIGYTPGSGAVASQQADNFNAAVQ